MIYFECHDPTYLTARASNRQCDEVGHRLDFMCHVYQTGERGWHEVVVPLSCYRGTSSEPYRGVLQIEFWYETQMLWVGDEGVKDLFIEVREPRFMQDWKASDFLLLMSYMDPSSVRAARDAMEGRENTCDVSCPLCARSLV